MLKKPLDRISDQEEEVFKDQLRYSVEELDNLKAISETEVFKVELPFDGVQKMEELEFISENDDEANSDSAPAETIRLNLTTQRDGMIAQNIYIPEEKKAEIDRLANEVKAQLSGSANLKKAILAKLIKEELDNE
jgi:translation initiation factor 1 (eIF-1/SUI1)